MGVSCIDESILPMKAARPPSEEEFLRFGLVKEGIYKRLEFAIQSVLDGLSEITFRNMAKYLEYSDSPSDS